MQRGSPLSTILAHSIEALGNPFVAVLLGLVLAAGLFFTSKLSMRMVHPERPGGVALMSMSLFARLLAATAALMGYQGVAPNGLTPFGFALAGGFLVMYLFDLVRFAGLHRCRRPVAVRR